MPDRETQQRLSSMAPPDPPLPYKTWRGTTAIAVAALVFIAAIGLIVFRWAQLQSFSPELHLEGYHRFSGTLLAPLRILASDMIKLRVLTADGKELVLPPVPEVRTDARAFASFPSGTCVEGYVHVSKGYLSQAKLTIEGTDYLLSGEADWVITKQ